MTRRSWLLLLILASLWGASYMFIKVALEDLSAEALVFARCALAALVLLPIALRRGALEPLRGRLAGITVLALIQVAVPFLLIALGEREISSSLTGILVSAAPIFTALLAIRLDQDERSRGWSLVGVVVGMVGVVLLFGADLGGDSAALLGGLMVLLASLGYAVGAFMLKHRFAGVPAVGVAASTMAVSAALTLPFALLAAPVSIDLETAGAVLALGAGGTGIAFLIFYTLIADVGPARASLVAYIAPAFAVAYGATLLDERITAAAVAGLVLILAGSYVAARTPGAKDLGSNRSGPSRSTAPEPARAR